MKPRPKVDPPEAVEWLLRLLLRLHPEWFRDRYEEEIVTCFRDEWRDEVASHGILAGLRVFARTGLGAVSTSWRQRPRISALDFRLGARRLIRYPGVTILSVVSMAFVILGGAVVFEVVTQLVRPDLRFPDGDRVVGLQVRDRATNRPDNQLAFDLIRWRNELETVEELGAYRIVPSNLVVRGGLPTVVEAAQISASAFRTASVAPVMGRVLDSEDERINADPVAVIGQGLWVRAFGADPNVVGREATLGGAEVTIVGVMPSGFGFPVNNEFWVPLRMDLGRWGPGEGPELRVFGRLAPGVTLASAQREVRARGAAVRGERDAGATPMNAEVVPYPQTILDVGELMSDALLFSVPILLFALLVVGNVSLLVFARALSREKDIVVRTALGATRSRIIIELFAETLVLLVPAVLVGLAFIRFALEQTFMVLRVGADVPLPYWIAPTLSPMTVAYTLVLGVAAALAVALLPGLRLTAVHGRKESPGFNSLGARVNQTTSNPVAFRFGGIWNVVIVCQIAVAAPLTAFVVTLERGRQVLLHPDFGFAVEEFVGGNLLGFDRTEPSAAPNVDDAGRLYALRLEQLRERLLGDPRVLGVAYTEGLPGTYSPNQRMQVDGLEATNANGQPLLTRTRQVSADYFPVLGIQVLAGRDFTSSDLSTRDVVIVNEGFVRRILNGGNAVGRRIRWNSFGQDSFSPWYEIVGVARDTARGTSFNRGQPPPATVYESIAPSLGPVSVIVHAREQRDEVLALLQAAVVEVDPMLRLRDPIRLEDIYSDQQRIEAYLRLVFTCAYGVAVLLAIGGLYAVMSFTVTHRTREIGIRRALGASRTRILAATLRRPLLQASAGVSIGAAILKFWLVNLMPPDMAVPAVMSVLLGICFLATVVPARKALMVEPTDALRADG